MHKWWPSANSPFYSAFSLLFGCKITMVGGFAVMDFLISTFIGLRPNDYLNVLGRFTMNITTLSLPLPTNPIDL